MAPSFEESDHTWLQLGIGSGEPTEVRTSLAVDAQDHARDDGWVYCRAKDPEHMHRMFAHILHFLRDVERRSIDPSTEGDEVGLRVLSDPLESCPDRADNPEYYRMISRPTSLQTITHRIVHCEYASPALFEQDMLQLFCNARIWYGLGSEGYAEMVTLLRLYNELTPSQARLTDAIGIRHGKSRMSDVDVVSAQRSLARASQHFSSSIYGPGREPPSEATVRDVVGMDAAAWKGRVYHVGDWVHLMNPVDPSRPIVGQIFRLYKQRKIPGIFLSACWYYRPEQTHHTETRHFFPNEVVQTAVYGEHAIEDIIEDILVLYLPIFKRARPAAPYWQKESPLYVVESKYDVTRHTFHRIDVWTSNVPAQVRAKKTPMDVFVEPVEMPVKSPSILLHCNVPGGMLIDEQNFAYDPEEWPDLFEGAVSLDLPSRLPAVPLPAQTMPPAPAASQTDRLRAYATFHTAAMEVARRVSPAAYAKLQKNLMTRPLASHSELGAMALGAGDVSPTLLIHLRDAAVAAGMLTSVHANGVSSSMSIPKECLPSSAAVFATYKQGAEFKALASETRRLFRQDPQGNVLWYAAPPIPGWNSTRLVLDGTTPLPVPSMPFLEYIVRTSHKRPRT